MKLSYISTEDAEKLVKKNQTKTSTGNKKPKTPIGHYDSYSFDKESFLTEVRNSASTIMNSSRLARKYEISCHNKPVQNGGQVLANFARDNGVNIAKFNAHMKISGRDHVQRIRRPKRRVYKSKLSVPLQRSGKKLKLILKDKIASKAYNIGIKITPKELKNNKININGVLEETKTQIYGRKIPLQELLQNEIKRLHTASVLRLTTDQEYIDMAYDTVVQKLNNHGIEYNKNMSLTDLTNLLKTTERTIHIKMWHDHSDILNHTYISFMASLIYDTANFLTNEELKIQRPMQSKLNAQTIVERPNLYIFGQSGINDDNTSECTIPLTGYGHLDGSENDESATGSQQTSKQLILPDVTTPLNNVDLLQSGHGSYTNRSAELKNYEHNSILKEVTAPLQIATDTYTIRSANLEKEKKNQKEVTTSLNKKESLQSGKDRCASSQKDERDIKKIHNNQDNSVKEMYRSYIKVLQWKTVNGNSGGNTSTSVRTINFLDLSARGVNDEAVVEPAELTTTRHQDNSIQKDLSIEQLKVGYNKAKTVQARQSASKMNSTTNGIKTCKRKLFHNDCSEDIIQQKRPKTTMDLVVEIIGQTDDVVTYKKYKELLRKFPGNASFEKSLGISLAKIQNAVSKRHNELKETISRKIGDTSLASSQKKAAEALLDQWGYYHY